MNLSLFNFGSLMSDAKNIGDVWKPKTQRLRVGSDISPLTSTAVGETGNRTITVAEGDDVRLKSTGIFDWARQASKQGSQVKNFRLLDDAQFSPSAGGQDKTQGASATSSVLYDQGKRSVVFSGGKLFVLEKDDSGEPPVILDEFTVTGDSRLSWDKDGNAVFTSGRDALTGGKLVAGGANEILIRTSGVDVEAGAGTTVLNLSSEGGSFSGGDKVTYLGAYQGCTFEGGAGDTTYAGYFSDSTFLAGKGKGLFSGVFEKAEIEGGDKDDQFSGYFSASTISGKGGTDIFNGMFLNGCKLSGDEDDDRFTGRFIDSALTSGAGNDVLGSLVDVAKAENFKRPDGNTYRGLAADFVDTEVDAGEGNDSFNGVAFGGSLNLGAGDDSAAGVFTSVRVDGGEGNDSVTALYSRSSAFETGAGDNSFTLATATASVVHTGEGASIVNLGHSPGVSSQSDGATLSGSALTKTLWNTPDDPLPKEFGELSNNRVEAELGENTIHMHNGQGINSVATGTATSQTEAADRKSQKNQAAGKGKADSDTSDAAGQEPAGGFRMGTESSLPLPLLSARTIDVSDVHSDARAPETGKESAEDRHRRRALERYATLYGDALVTEGNTAAVINTGTEEEIILKGARRQIYEAETDDMKRYTHKRNAFGQYESLRSKFI